MQLSMKLQNPCQWNIKQDYGLWGLHACNWLHVCWIVLIGVWWSPRAQCHKVMSWVSAPGFCYLCRWHSVYLCRIPTNSQAVNVILYIHAEESFAFLPNLRLMWWLCCSDRPDPTSRATALMIVEWDSPTDFWVRFFMFDRNVLKRIGQILHHTPHAQSYLSSLIRLVAWLAVYNNNH